MASKATRLLLPALLFAAALFVLLRIHTDPPFLAYFLAAVLIGMGIAAAQRAFRPPPDE